MRIYRITVIGDRYPTDFNVEASSWATAIGRAVREWQKKFKGSRTLELRVKAFKSSHLLQGKEDKKD